MSTINQKEYLKKYLSIGNKDEKKKKKRRKKVATGDRVQIIDDDIDLSQLTSFEEAADLFNTNEDAPQIAGVIDERPMHLRIDDYRKSDLWKPLGDQDATDVNPVQKEDQKDLSPVRHNVNHSIGHSNKMRYSEDNSPPRKNKNNESSSPKRKKRDDDESDNTPPRRNRRYSDDNSPPRKKQIDGDNSPPRKRKYSDSSPPRRMNNDEVKDYSSPRRKRRASDASPPRRSRANDRDDIKDNSPPRRTRKDSNTEDNSPPRRKPRDLDSSPPRRFKKEASSLPTSSKTPEEPKRKLLPGDKKGKYLIPAKRNDKMVKTLEGKNAGLQSAKELVKENETFRKREDELFKNMSAEMSGANATTVMRDRKTGKIRDLQKEAEEQREKEKTEEENKRKYTRWGRGLKQVEDYEDKLAQDLHEMNKPLARYADDEDLEKFLKEQEREGDPMLAYIRKKKKKKVIESGKPLKPQYEGETPPNRFGIRPGYRWDGVDRSSGYEKKWFQVQNEKRAAQEEVYRWSTEDM